MQGSAKANKNTDPSIERQARPFTVLGPLRETRSVDLGATSAPRIEVSALDLSDNRAACPTHQSFPFVRNWSRVLGVLGTLSLHVLVLGTLGFASTAHKVRPPEPKGAGANAIESSVPPAGELVLLRLDDGNQRRPEDLSGAIALSLPDLTDIRAELNPEPPAAVSVEDADGTAAVSAEAGDPALRAMMFGRYTGQISARIQRAWVRPRSPVNAVADLRGSHAQASRDTFLCRVQIRQDERGDVQEVLLLSCNGTEAWRHSLVVAINQSSPLPAPPIPSVFARALTMTFEAQTYEPGAPADEYERQAPAGAIVSNTLPVRSSAQPFDAPSRGPNSSSRDNRGLINR
jgi:hypothetical protein